VDDKAFIEGWGYRSCQHGLEADGKCIVRFLSSQFIFLTLLGLV